MATRLQADGDGKEAKWADIDDDEDDWAPETIEWNDGTKITLSQNDSAAILAEEQAATAAAKDRQDQEKKSKVSAQQKPTTTVGPNATVLKPRSSAQQKSTGLVLKTPSDKPTLVAKPSAPAPVRSPWASLPPIDKVPPVAINPPSQPSVSRPHLDDPYGNNNIPLPPSSSAVAAATAVEIAADDFTRTRRETQNGNLGQLYNAQSGQYEPANAGRRGSVRKEQGFRPPSLLQRGSTNDQRGPAEPSAAFQRQRSSSQQEINSSSRRRSSVVSGDSQARRPSVSKGSDSSRIPNDSLQQRRDSMQSQPLQSPSTPGHRQTVLIQHDSSPAQHPPQAVLQSPTLQQPQTLQDPRSPIAIDSAAPSTRDEVAAQKRLMKEKRELAIKRKREEEEREEAAKKERIRLKMEKLGMPPLPEKNEPHTQEFERKAIEKREVEPKKQGKKQKALSDINQGMTLVQDASIAVPRSPPKPPIPGASGAPQQYGMMKVHGTSATSVGPPSSERSTVEESRVQVSSENISSAGPEPTANYAEPLPSPTVNGVSPHKQADRLPQSGSSAPNQDKSQESRQQPWGKISRDSSSFTGWNGQGITRDASASNNVWGPPSYSKTLGNGIFDRSVQRPQSRPQEQFSVPPLAPIGPPKHLQRPREPADSLRPNDVSPTSVEEDFQTMPTFPPVETSAPSIGRSDVNNRGTSGETQIMTSHFGAGSEARQQMNNVELLPRGPEQQRSALAAWGNSPITLAREDAERSRQLTQLHAARLAEEARTGIRHEPQLPIMNETWRQVKVDEQGGQRHVVGVSRGQSTHSQLVGSQMKGDPRNASFANSANMVPASTVGASRESRFFPSAGKGIQAHFQTGSPWIHTPRRVASPPPPDTATEFHPAFTGDRQRPLVNLPFMKQKPKVRLPPPLVTPINSPIMAELRAIPFRAASQPLVNNPSWQDRFNGLLGVKKSSPETKFAHVANFSATKVPLELPPIQASASVSLPPRNEAFSHSLSVASKNTEDEEALFENREFGSLPVVLIPTKAPEVGWAAARPMKKGQNKQSRLSKEVEAASKETFSERETISNSSVSIFVYLSGMPSRKCISMSRRAELSASQGGPRPRNFPGNAKSGKNVRIRDNAGNHTNSQKSSPGGSQKNASHGGSNQQPRTQSIKSQSAWGPRTTNVVT